MEGDAAPVLAADGRPVYILRLFARRAGAGGLDAGDEKVETAEVAAEDGEFGDLLLGDGVGDVGAFGFKDGDFA